MVFCSAWQWHLYVNVLQDPRFILPIAQADAIQRDLWTWLKERQRHSAWCMTSSELVLAMQEASPPCKVQDALPEIRDPCYRDHPCDGPKGKICWTYLACTTWHESLSYMFAALPARSPRWLCGALAPRRQLHQAPAPWIQIEPFSTRWRAPGKANINSRTPRDKKMGPASALLRFLPAMTSTTAQAPSAVPISATWQWPFIFNTCCVAVVKIDKEHRRRRKIAISKMNKKLKEMWDCHYMGRRTSIWTSTRI